jgi:hypothetical protein
LHASLRGADTEKLMLSGKTNRMAATAEVAPGGMALLVGIGGRLVVVCAAAAMDAGLRHVMISGADEACARMKEVAPRVVVVPGSMDRRERERIGAAAREIDAEIVDLAAIVLPAEVAHAVARALATCEGRRATDARGPSTQRAP